MSDELRRFALDLLDETDAIVLGHLRAAVGSGTRDPLGVRTKADSTFVTQVDTEVESLIRDRIAGAYPGHGVLGEEFGTDPGDGETRWIVDPIDGTNNLVRGIPVFGTLLAVEHAGELVAAAISAPALSRRWHAVRGEGAVVRDLLGERPIQVSSVHDLGQAQLVTAGVAAMEVAGFAAPMQQLRSAAWRDRGFGDFWGYMLVAEGVAEVMLEVGVTVWDLAAPALIVSEAGGRFTDFAGTPSYTGPQSLATNGALHEAVLSVLEGEGQREGEGG